MPGPRTERLELAPRSDGARYRRVTLFMEPEGSLTLRSHEMGATQEAAWGLDDDEVTLSVPEAQVGRLVLALAASFLERGDGAIERLAELCAVHEVSFRLGHWT